jgi:hypothetical protein
MDGGEKWIPNQMELLLAWADFVASSAFILAIAVSSVR